MAIEIQSTSAHQLSCPCRLDTLVDDVWIEILCTLSVNDILHLRSTCKRFSSLTTLRCIWLRKFCSEVLTHHLPVPGPHTPLLSMSAHELEWRTCHALHLNRRWSKATPNPVIRHERILSGEHVDQVLLIPEGNQLLTVIKDTLMCWSIPEEPDCMQSPMKLAEWNSPFGGDCKILRDRSTTDMVVAASKNESNSTVLLSVASAPVFHEIKRYAELAGKPIALHDNLLFLHVPASEENDGGIEIVDWQSETSGSVFLPCYLDLFDGLVDVTFFSNHVLVVWEKCISVFPYPHIPSTQRAPLDRLKIYTFNEPVAQPIAFTTCQSRIPSKLGFSDPEYSPANDLMDSLTIVARSRADPSKLTQFMLSPNFSDSTESLELLLSENRFSYKLSRFPTSYVSPACADKGGYSALCLGSSGRGIWVEGTAVRQCAPSVTCLPPFDLRFTPTFEPTNPVCYLGEGKTAPWSVDFDEGMGRVVAVDADAGGVVVYDLD